MAAQFQIEKGVPLPSLDARCFYPLREMEVGDSFVVPLSKRASLSCLFGRYAPKRFTSRKISETELRVWRVE